MKAQSSNSIWYQSSLHLAIVGLISIGLTAALAIGVSTANAQIQIHTPYYNVTDLGVLPAKKANVSIPAAINDQGQVTGTSGMTDIDESAFLYDPKQAKGAMEDLSRNYGGISHGFALNAVGDVVGDATFGGVVAHAALFRNGEVLDLDTLKGEFFSRATGINASVQVVGFSNAKPDESSRYQAFIWTPSTGMVILGTLGGESAQAFAINDAGFVTGTAQIGESGRVAMTHAFLYQPVIAPGIHTRKMVDLGTLGGNDSYGTAVNANNHVVGYSTMKGGLDRVHAFLHDGIKMRDLGSLDSSLTGNDQSYALGMNSFDQVVGYSYVRAFSGNDPPTRQTAFIYTQGAMMDLNGLIGNAAKQYWLNAATAINNKGQIVAMALDLDTNEIHAVLLTQ